MTTDLTPIRNRGLAAVVGGFALFTGTLHAAPFLYSSGDLVLAFRQTGNASDYVVNIGRATNYNALPAGTTVTITNLSATQLAAAFPSLNGVKWSVAGANRPVFDPNYPAQTLWVTAPRSDAATQSAPWVRKGQAVQGNAGSQIDGVGANAALASSNLPAGANNTAAGVVIPVNHNFNIGQVIGTSGNYANNFQGRVENQTPDDFAETPSNVSRSDLYELLPGTSAGGTLNAPGRHLGYFELKADGTLVFSTGTALPAAPTITGITRDGDVSIVSFQSSSGVTYRLHRTDAGGLATPVSTWTAGATVTGNGAVQTLQDTRSDATSFYSIEAQP